MASATTTTDPAVEDLAGVVWRLWRAADLAFQAAGPEGDLELDLLSMAARNAAWAGADLLADEHRGLCDVPASAERVPAALIREAEQVLAARPVEQWPAGASRLVVEVCDLVREHGR
ncbi:hypothetical protein DUHN55_46570 [Helicobacter pylori]